VASDGFDQPSGLADRLDDLLLRVEGWSDRSRSVITMATMVVVAVLVGWWLTRPADPAVPVEELIPRAGADPAAGKVPETDPASPPDVEPGPTPGGLGSGPQAEPADGPPLGELVVHVVGQVRRPGLVSLAPGARISDAVEAAGGPLGTADVERLNLATPLVDGMQIRVPSQAEADGPEGAEGGPLVRMPDGAGAGAPEAEPATIDLNRAGPAELEALPGIGPAIAAAIVTWRDDNGGFATVDDLLEVPGIGPAKLAALRDRVSV
jgi:competence protein ComEA